MKRAVCLSVLSLGFCLLAAPLCSAQSPTPPSVDQTTARLLQRVLQSEEGRGIKPFTVSIKLATVVYVTPYVPPAVQPPRKPHKRVHTDILFLITASGHFYCFYLTPNRVKYAWSTPLVAATDKAAMGPTGSLGRLLAASGKAVPNSVSAGAGMGFTFLAVLDMRQPLVVYRLVHGKLVRVAG